MPPTSPTRVLAPSTAAPPDRDFCSTLARDEPLAGTAPHRPVWALVDHPGPWGREAVPDAPWPVAGLGRLLATRTESAGVRLVLSRRPRRRGAEADADHAAAADPAAPRRVLLARCGPGGWLAERDVPTAGLGELDWAGLAAAARAPDGWVAADPVWAVCTHGTRDACCARLGRPLAQAFEAALPGSVQEISHSGGHRLAGVALALPTGQMFGRVGPTDAAALVGAVAAGRTVDALLRGEVHRSAVEQVASAALRDHLGEDRMDALTPTGGEWEHIASDGVRSRWRVTVEAETGPVRPPSCGAPPEASTVLRVTSMQRR